MRKLLSASIALIAAQWVCCAMAAAPDLAPVSRKARMDARNARLAATAKAKAKEDPRPAMEFALGMSHDREEGDRQTLSTPFSASYQTPGDADWTKFEITGDGWTRATEPGAASAEGLADLTFNLYRPVSAPWTAVLGASVPTGGVAESGSATQHVRLCYQTPDKAAWTHAAWGDIKHYNASSAGQSKSAQTVYAEVARHFDGDHVLLTNVTYSRRRGAAPSTATDLGIEYDFPLLRKQGLGGAVMLTRGLTPAARHTSVEFDLLFSF